MAIKQQLDTDLKAAMLGGDKFLATTIRGLKSAILYVEVAEGKRDKGLSDDAIIAIFMKEAKKRQESADMYTQGGNSEKAQAELDEKAVIERYLPAQMSDEELASIVDGIVAAMGTVTRADTGKIIGQVRDKAGPSVDGSRIAKMVQSRIHA